jgi:hypothetical protein
MNALFFRFCLPFLVFIALLFSSNNLYAAQAAIVKARKAIVYADTDMKIPLGYVRQGKKIKVGNVSREHNMLLPIVISGKIGYIKVDDLILKDFDKEEVTDRKDILDRYQVNLEEEQIDDLTKNNHFRISLGAMNAGDEWRLLSEGAGDGDPSALKEFMFHIEHRPPFRNFNWSIGVGYYSLAQSTLQLQTFTFESNFYYSPWKSNIVRLDFYAGLLATGDVQVQESTLNSITDGAGWGYTLGGILRVFTHQRLGLHLGLANKKIFVTSLNNIETGNVASTFNITQIGGAELYFGLSYAL